MIANTIYNKIKILHEENIVNKYINVFKQELEDEDKLKYDKFVSNDENYTWDMVLLVILYLMITLTLILNSAVILIITLFVLFILFVRLVCRCTNNEKDDDKHIGGKLNKQDFFEEKFFIYTDTVCKKLQISNIWAISLMIEEFNLRINIIKEKYVSRITLIYAIIGLVATLVTIIDVSCLDNWINGLIMLKLPINTLLIQRLPMIVLFLFVFVLLTFFLVKYTKVTQSFEYNLHISLLKKYMIYLAYGSHDITN